MAKGKKTKMQTEDKNETRSGILYVRVTPSVRILAVRAAEKERRSSVSDWVRVAIEEKLERDGIR